MAAPTIAIVPTEGKSVVHNEALKGFELKGDLTSPGVSQYYGTDAAGVQSYHSLPVSASGTITTADGLSGDGSAGDPAIIATDGVTTAKILNANVTTDKLANVSVTTAKLADDSVTADKIVDGAVGADALEDIAGLAPGLYTNPDVTVDVNGRVTVIANGTAGASQAFFTPTGADAGFGIGSGTVVTFQNPGMTIAIPAGEMPKSLVVDLPAAVYDGGGELDVTITHPDGLSQEAMMCIIPEVRYMEATTNTGGIGDNIAGDQVLANAPGSITVQYINANTITPNATAIIQFP